MQSLQTIQWKCGVFDWIVVHVGVRGHLRNREVFWCRFFRRYAELWKPQRNRADESHNKVMGKRSESQAEVRGSSMLSWKRKITTNETFALRILLEKKENVRRS